MSKKSFTASIQQTTAKQLDRAMYSGEELPEEFVRSLAEVNGAALAVAHDGTIQVGAFTFTATGLVVNGQTTLGEWESVGGVLRRLDASIQWLIGDWINYGERQWGKTYEQVAEATGYEVTALRNFAYVANAVDSSLRSDELSFGHHQLVAPMEPELQQQWLDYARTNGLSISQMRDAIAGKPPALSSGRAGRVDKTLQWALKSQKKALEAAKTKDATERQQLRQLAEAQMEWWRKYMESFDLK